MLSAFVFETCTQHFINVPKVNFEKTYFINDDKGKISHKPFQISCETDKFMDFTIFPDKIIRYDYDSNKVITIFDSIKFNIDSVIAQTYQVAYKSKFLYLPHKPEALQNANKNLYQISPISSDNEHYYIPIGIKSNAEFVFQNINENGDKNKVLSPIEKKTIELEKKKLDSIKQIYGNSKVVSVEMNNFIIVTDKNFKQISMFPLYYESAESFVAKRKRGYVYNNTYYFSLLLKSIKVLSDEKDISGYEPASFFTAFSFSKNGITATKPIIDKKLINPEEYSLVQNSTRQISYGVNENQLIASMGRELLNLTANKLYTIQPKLEEKEYITNFGFKEDYVIYTTNKYVKRKVINKEFLAAGYTDTLGFNYLKVQDRKNKDIVLTKELKLNAMYTISQAGNLYEYIESGDSLKINKYTIKLND